MRLDMDDGEADSEWTGGPKELGPPPDQLQLTEQELKEEFTRVLTADNPHAPPNIIRFSFKERAFKQVRWSYTLYLGFYLWILLCKVSTIEQTAFHFSLDSNLLHKESDEAQRQLAKQESVEESSEDSEGEGSEDGERGKGGKDTQTGSDEKRLRNQFNFSERASQTLNNPYRVRWGTRSVASQCTAIL